MNIIISPSGKPSMSEIFRYVRLVRATLEKVMEKHPRSNRMFVGVDDTVCLHDFYFDGIKKHSPLSYRATCSKCGSSVYVKHRTDQPALALATNEMIESVKGECDG